MWRDLLLGLFISLAALGAAACTGATTPGGSNGPAAPEEAGEHVPGSDCPNEEEVVARVETRKPGTIEADVTGDGDTEEVFLHVDPSGGEGCRAFVAVTGHALLSAPVDTDDGGTDMGLPALGFAASIDDRPGADIVVNVRAGAAVQFVSVYSAGGERLERLSIEGSQPPARDLFGSGGSVGHLEAVDCASSMPGEIVASAAQPVEARYEVTRTFYRADGGVLSVVDEQRRRMREERVFELAEFAATPFGSCLR